MCVKLTEAQAFRTPTISFRDGLIQKLVCTAVFSHRWLVALFQKRHPANGSHLTIQLQISACQADEWAGSVNDSEQNPYGRLTWALACYLASEPALFFRLSHWKCSADFIQTTNFLQSKALPTIYTRTVHQVQIGSKLRKSAVPENSGGASCCGSLFLFNCLTTSFVRALCVSHVSQYDFMRLLCKRQWPVSGDPAGAGFGT